MSGLMKDMKEKIKPNPEDTTTEDAHAAAEAMVADEENLPEIDFDRDYEMAQKMSQSESDRPHEAAQNSDVSA